MKKVLIGGIGNVLLGDDGVGPYVARLLDARYEFEDSVEILDLGTPALDLIDQLSSHDAVIFVDSIDIRSGLGNSRTLPQSGHHAELSRRAHGSALTGAGRRAA